VAPWIAMSTILDDATFTNCGTSAGKANRSPAQCPLQQYKRAASAKEAASSAISCAAQVAIHRVATICASKVCATDSYTAVNAACQASTILAAVANVAIRRVTCMTQSEAKPAQMEETPALSASPSGNRGLHPEVFTSSWHPCDNRSAEVMPSLSSALSGNLVLHLGICTGKRLPYDSLKAEAQADNGSQAHKVGPPDGPRPGFTRQRPVRKSSTAPLPVQEDPSTQPRNGHRPCKASSAKMAIMQLPCTMLSDQVCSSPHRWSKCFQEDQLFKKPSSALVRACSSHNRTCAGTAELLREPLSLHGIGGNMRDAFDGPRTSRTPNTDLPLTPGRASFRCKSLYNRNAWRRRTWSGKPLEPLQLQQTNLS